MRWVSLCAVMLAGLTMAQPAGAQQSAPGTGRSEVTVSSGVDPGVVTVGDPFRAVVRIDAPAGYVVEFPEDVGRSEAYQSIAAVDVLPGEGADPHIAIYPLVIWQTSSFAPPIVAIHLRDPAGREQVLRVTLPLPEIRSVLPPDTAGVEPRPSRGVMDPETAPSPWWPWLAVVLLALLLAVAWLAWVFLRRRGDPVPADPALARRHALAELDAARALIHDGEVDWKPYFTRVSAAVRGYLAAISPVWSRDLTTTELIRATDEHLDDAGREALAEVLADADSVKFARGTSALEVAEHRRAQAIHLIETLDSPAPRSSLASRDREGAAR
jgi:hypothetical protein